MELSEPIILIGPMCSGKSTIAKLLAERMNLPRFELDELRWDYYREIGYNDAMGAKIVEEKGILGLLEYLKPFDVYTVERVVTECKRGVIDFGAGHSVFEDEEQFSRLQSVLFPFNYVILLLPSPDQEKSIHILNNRLIELLKRELGSVDRKILQLNEHFVKHRSNRKLAKMTIYTAEKTAEETCNEVCRQIARLDQSMTDDRYTKSDELR